MEQQGINGGGSIVRDIQELAEKYLEPQVRQIEDPSNPEGAPAHALITAEGQNVRLLRPEDFDPFRERPMRRKGTATLTTTESFIEHVNRFKDADSIVFADDDRKAPSLTAVLDYHHAGAESLPRFGEHRAVFRFPLSDEWQAWDKHNAAPMNMIEFAAFLEDRVVDVMQLGSLEELSAEQQQFIKATNGAVATPSQLLAMSVSLKVNESAAVHEVRNLTSGEAEVKFSSAHETQIAGDVVKVPSVFIIAIPVFKGGDLYRVLARLRYRNAGGLKFWFELWRTERVFDHALAEACEKVQAETGLPLLYGKPE